MNSNIIGLLLVFVVSFGGILVTYQTRKKYNKIIDKAQHSQRQIQQSAKELKESVQELRKLKYISQTQKENIQNSCGHDSMKECTLCEDECVFRKGRGGVSK